MPDASQRVKDFLRDWLHTRARAAVLKLPRERPDLLVFVCMFAILLAGLWAGVFANHL